LNPTTSRADLSIVPDVVALTARRIEDLSRKADALVATTELLTGDQVSHGDLAEALRGYTGEWNQQMRGARLAETATSYHRADGEITDELTSSALPDALT
jgi:hypothetical protein